jgi:hypothetical protein
MQVMRFQNVDTHSLFMMQQDTRKPFFAISKTHDDHRSAIPAAPALHKCKQRRWHRTLSLTHRFPVIILINEAAPFKPISVANCTDHL